MKRFRLFRQNGQTGKPEHVADVYGTEDDDEVTVVLDYARRNSYANGARLFAVADENFVEVAITVARNYTAEKV